MSSLSTPTAAPSDGAATGERGRETGERGRETGERGRETGERGRETVERGRGGAVERSGVGIRTLRSELRFQDDRLCIVSAGQLVVATWFDAPTTAQLRALRRASRALSGERPGLPQVLLASVIAQQPRFSEEVRDELARQATGLARVACAFVVPLGGLRGVGIRAVLSHQLVAAARGERSRVFARVEAAGAWLVGELQGAASDGQDMGAAEWSAEQLVQLQRETIHRSRRPRSLLLR